MFIYLYFFRYVLFSHHMIKYKQNSCWYYPCNLYNFHKYSQFWREYFYYYLIPLRVFHISISRLSFTRFWVTAGLLKSSWLLSVFWPILTVLSFGWSPLAFLFPILSIPLPIVWWLYRAQRLQLVSSSLSCSNLCYGKIFIWLPTRLYLIQGHFILGNIS